MSLPFSELSAFSALFRAYCAQDARITRYFANHFQSEKDRIETAKRVAAHPRNREVLVEVLLEQNTRWGLDDKTRANIEQLRDPESVAVVTGQQVGIFTGALYTPLKTITAIQLAQQLAAETKRAVVPIFWLEGEDHDLEEVSYFYVPKGNDLEKLTYTGHTLPENGNLGAVGRLAFTAQIEELVSQVEELLPPTEFKPALMAQIRAIYREGETFRHAFAKMMKVLFPNEGLIFITPDDLRLKTLVKPLFQQEILDYALSSAKLKAVSEPLKTEFHAQVNPRPLNMFLMTDEGRYALEPHPEKAGFFRLRGRETTFSQDELLQLLEDEPNRFSPNVVLRPIMQDLLLPTAAYIAGPGEIAYFAQFKPIYEWAHVPMPIIYPRASATILEGRIAKILSKYDLTVSQLSGDFEQLFKQMVLAQSDKELEVVYANAVDCLHSSINQVKMLVAKVDPSLERTAEATRAALLNELEKLNKKILQAEKRNHEQMRDQLFRAQNALFPNGGLQERTLSVLPLLNKYGLDLMKRWTETIPLDTTSHQILNV